MKIKRLEIKNWIGIKELSFDAGKINIISGRKGSGKSSIVESLQKGFENINNRVEVVRHGEEEAIIYIATNTGLDIERRIRNSGKADYLKIRKPGESVPQTETFLRKLINGEIFRPLEFVNKPPGEQARIVLNMLEIAWEEKDITAWFGEIPPEVNYHAHILQVLKQIETLYYEERESINREIRFLKAQIEGIKRDLPQNYDGEHWKKQKIQEYYSRVAEAEENNRKIVAARNLTENLENRIAVIMAEAEADKEDKKGLYNRKRSDIREFRQFIQQKIEKNEEAVAQVESRVKQAEEALDLELQQKIQALKEEYTDKKHVAREEILTKALSMESDITQYRETLAAKEQELAGLDELQEQTIAAIDAHARERAETENARAGNAWTIIDSLEEIDVGPLTVEAEEVAEMQSYLREYDRMVGIIREKLAPKEEQSETLTAKIEKARKLPMELLKTASVPVPGINVDEKGHIRIGQTLIDGLSDGEKMEFAFRVAKAQAGDLKVICLDGIQNINESDRKWIEEEAAADDYQYFLILTDDGDLKIETKEEIA